MCNLRMTGEELDQGNLLLAGINYNKNIYKNPKNHRNFAKKLSQNTKNASAVTAKLAVNL